MRDYGSESDNGLIQTKKSKDKPTLPAKILNKDQLFEEILK